MLLRDKSRVATILGPLVPFKEHYLSSFGEHSEPKKDGLVVAMLTLSHTSTENRLYQAMLAEATAGKTRVCAFSIRQLMVLSQLPNYSAIRRGIEGLISKLSIEHYRVVGDGVLQPRASVYLIFSPEEILARRSAVSLNSGHSKRVQACTETKIFTKSIERVAERLDLSRREAQVALCCAEGLTNREIGERLFISGQTVKFHLRHIFIKYGVKRRTELVSRLLTTQERSSKRELTSDNRASGKTTTL